MEFYPTEMDLELIEKYSIEFNEFSNYIYVMKQISDVGWNDFVYDYIN